MKWLSAALVGIPLIFSASPVLSAGFIETAIGNTVSVTVQGVETRTYYKADGTVISVESTGRSDTGTWSAKDGQLCTAFPKRDNGAEYCHGVSSIDAAIGSTVPVTISPEMSYEATFLAGVVAF